MISLKSLQAHFIEILHLRESSHRTALAFAIGVLIAFSPTYGFHTLTVIFFAWAFRLNFAALMLGALINNPWTVAPILGGTMWTGFIILGMPHTPSFNWNELSLESLYSTIIPYILPFTIGACVLSLIGATLAYPLALILVSWYRKGQAGK